MSSVQPSSKAAERGEPSYVWRSGQQRRLDMIQSAAGERARGTILENGCGLGLYLERLAPLGGQVIGLEFELDRAREAKAISDQVLGGAGENLPFPSATFDLILSNEVIEHVADDHKAIREMARTLKPGGRIVVFCPNRWYPFETHGIYWKGEYHFGNKLFINYLPRAIRNKLAPHVRAYSRRDLQRLFDGLPVRFITRRVIFGGYDNITSRSPKLGRWIRSILYALERTPLQGLGLSHFWVVEKLEG